MTRYIILLSLIVVPLYELILYFLIPGRTYPMFQDMRMTKDFMAMAFALIISLSIISKHGIKPFKNIWALSFIGFLAWNLFKIPNATIPIHIFNINGLWNYQPAYQIMVYFLLFLAIYSLPELHRVRTLSNIFKTMAVCGAVMALYVVSQKFGVDQIMQQQPIEIVQGVRNANIGGTLGQPTLCAPFLVMIIPIALYLRWYLVAALLAVAAIMTGSLMAIFAMLGTFIVWMFIKTELKPAWMGVAVIGSIMVSAVAGYCLLEYDYFSDNGRLALWGNLLIDIIDNLKSVFTGSGIGSFKFLYSARHQSIWLHAHNEYIQLIFTCGLIGATLVGMFIYNTFKQAIDSDRDDVMALLMAFTSLLICALGTFVFQLAVYQFYSIIILGMIYNITQIQSSINNKNKLKNTEITDIDEYNCIAAMHGRGN